MRALTPTMEDTLIHMLEDSQTIYRRPDGLCWTTPNTPLHKGGYGPIAYPVWWVGLSTVQALARRGLVERDTRYIDEARRLTERGVQMATALKEAKERGISGSPPLTAGSGHQGRR